MSDTHGTCDDRMMKYVHQSDEIWHAGDWGRGVSEKLTTAGKFIKGVHGNIDENDIRHTYPEDLIWEMAGLHFFMTHIGGRPPRLPARVVNIIQQQKIDVFICGHSHMLSVARDQLTNALCLNPGAAGIHGFHKMRTMLRFEVINRKVSSLEAIEMGKRGQIN